MLSVFKNIYKDTKLLVFLHLALFLITVELVFAWPLTPPANGASMLLSSLFLRKGEPIPVSKVNNSLSNHSNLIPSHWVDYAGQCDRTLTNEISRILWRGFWESFLVLESTERNGFVFCWMLSCLNVRHRMVQLSCYFEGGGVKTCSHNDDSKAEIWTKHGETTLTNLQAILARFLLIRANVFLFCKPHWSYFYYIQKKSIHFLDVGKQRFSFIFSITD